MKLVANRNASSFVEKKIKATINKDVTADT